MDLSHKKGPALALSGAGYGFGFRFLRAFRMVTATHMIGPVSGTYAIYVRNLVRRP